MNTKPFALAFLAALGGAARADVLSNWAGAGTTTHYGGVLFDATASGPTDVRLTGRFNLNLDLPDAADATERIAVYYRTGTYVGFANSNAGWTLLGTATADVAGDGNRSAVDVGSSLLIPRGETFALAIFALDGGATGIGYTVGAGTSNQAPQTRVSDASLTLGLGAAKGFGPAANPFGTFTIGGQRVWRGDIEYQAVPEPASMAALGIGAVGLLRRRKRA